MGSHDRDEGLLTRTMGAVLQRMDAGWLNRLTGLGTARDKRSYTEVETELLGPGECEALYRNSAMHARAVDLPVKECFRAGWEVRVPGDVALGQAVTSRLSELRAAHHLAAADTYANLYGGGLVLVGTTSGDSRPSARLPLHALQSVDFLNHFACTEAHALEYYGDVGARDYGEVALYQLTPLFGGVASGAWSEVHASRTLRLVGTPLERQAMQANGGWGDSIYQRLHTTIRDWASSYDGVAHLLTDASQGVYTMPDLMSLLMSNRIDVVQAKFAMIDQAKSMLRAILLGKDEKYERVATPFAGIPEALQRLDFKLSADLGYPVTKLLGQAPAGLNATGAGDNITFAQAMSARQNDKLRGPLERLVRLIFLSRRGPSGGREPPQWSLVFRPLMELSPAERADYRLKVAQADQVYLTAQVVSPAEVAQSRFGGEEYSDETHLDETLPRELPTEPVQPAAPAPVPPSPSVLPGSSSPA